MNCQKCGKEIANNSVFCEYCGIQIEKISSSNAECKVHVKWFLYLAMLFTCILNPYIFEMTYTCEGGAAICPLLVQLVVFISASLLRYKKRIATLILLLSFFMLLCNILLFVDVITFDGYPDNSKLEYCYYWYGYYYHDSYILIFVSPLMLLLCMIYELYVLYRHWLTPMKP